MTFDKGNLRTYTPYYGYDHVIVGNGSRLQISHVGHTTLHSL